MLECVRLVALAKSRPEIDAISAGTKQDSLPHPTTHHPPTIKAPPKNKN